MITRRTLVGAAATGATLAAIGVSAPSPAVAGDTGDAAAIARNCEIARRYFEEVWNKGRLEVLDELLDPAYVNHTPSTPNPAPGPEGLKPIVAAIRRAFPDLHFRIEDIVATPDRTVVRTVMTGTHHGDLFGLAPTGRSVEVNQINIERIIGGHIVEHWRVTDDLALMRQLGAMGSQAAIVPTTPSTAQSPAKKDRGDGCSPGLPFLVAWEA